MCIITHSKWGLSSVTECPFHLAVFVSCILTVCEAHIVVGTYLNVCCLACVPQWFISMALLQWHFFGSNHTAQPTQCILFLHCEMLCPSKRSSRKEWAVLCFVQGTWPKFLCEMHFSFKKNSIMLCLGYLCSLFLASSLYHWAHTKDTQIKVVVIVSGTSALTRSQLQAYVFWCYTWVTDPECKSMFFSGWLKCVLALTVTRHPRLLC